MSETLDNLVLAHLRKFDAKLEGMREDLRDVKHRLTALEIGLANSVSAAASHYGSLANRLDRSEDRMDRIERRLEIVPGAAE